MIKQVYQSPYKGFNRRQQKRKLARIRINPPIRGSIDMDNYKKVSQEQVYQSPYKGFNRV